MGADFERFHYIIGMDDYNLHFMRAMQPAQFTGYVGRLLDFAPHLGLRDVEDPYYGGARHFELVLEQIETGADGLLAEIARKLAG